MKMNNLIHMVWSQGEPPPPARHTAEKWNAALPDFRVVWWDRERGARELPGFEKVAKASDHPVKTGDILRAFVLHRHGGLYVDHDTAPCDGERLRELFALLPNFLVLEDNGLNNAICRFENPRHLFLSRLIAALQAKPAAQIRREGIPESVSVQFWSQVFWETSKDGALPDVSLLAPSRIFGRVWQRDTELDPDPLSRHDFEHSWSGYRNGAGGGG